MPYSTPAKKYLRETQRRREAIASRRYCCSKCEYPLESQFHLKRHEKSCIKILDTGNDITAKTLSTPEVIQGNSTIVEPTVEEILPVVQAASVPHTDQASTALPRNQIVPISTNNRAASMPRTPSVPLVNRTNPPLSSTPKHAMPPGNRAVHAQPGSRVPARVSIDCKPSRTLPNIKHGSIQDDECLSRLDDDEIMKAMLKEEADSRSLCCIDMPLPKDPVPGDFEITSSQAEAWLSQPSTDC